MPMHYGSKLTMFSLLIMSLDLCALDQGIRDAVAQVIAEKYGITPNNILIACTHTHSGPATQYLLGWGETDPAYLTTLPLMLVKCASKAKENLAPAKCGASRIRINGVGVNREQMSLAPLDSAAQLMRFDRFDGSTLAVIYNFGAHGVVRYPFTSRISADWPGLVGAELQLAFPGAVPLFLQGACGDLNAHEMLFAEDNIEIIQKACDMRVGDISYRFSQQIIPALRAITTSDDIILQGITEQLTLPCVAPNREDLLQEITDNLELANSREYSELPPLYVRQKMVEDTSSAWREARFTVDSARNQLELLAQGNLTAVVPLQLLRIGESAIIGWPGEVFVNLGLECRQRSPVPLTFITTFANADVGYIPSEAAFESQGLPNFFGGYPVVFTPRIYQQLPFRNDVGKILVEASLALLKRSSGL